MFYAPRFYCSPPSHLPPLLLTRARNAGRQQSIGSLSHQCRPESVIRTTLCRSTLCAYRREGENSAPQEKPQRYAQQQTTHPHFNNPCRHSGDQQFTDKGGRKECHVAQHARPLSIRCLNHAVQGVPCMPYVVCVPSCPTAMIHPILSSRTPSSTLQAPPH